MNLSNYYTAWYSEVYWGSGINYTTDKTVVAFSEKGTPGLDPGYDAGMFPVNPFQLYTRFLVGGNDLKLVFQTLPEERYDEFAIPVGVEAPDGGTVTSNNSLSLHDITYTAFYKNQKITITGSKPQKWFCLT